MKKTTMFGFLVAAFLNAMAQTGTPVVSVLPQPVSVQAGTGIFVLRKTTAIEVSAADADTKRIAGYLSKTESTASGYAVPVKTAASGVAGAGNIRLAISTDTSLGEEGYKLTVNQIRYR